MSALDAAPPRRRARARRGGLELYPGVKVSIGPPIDDGFYYDFDFPEGVTISEDDFERIEAKMREHVKADEQFERTEVPVGGRHRALRGRGPGLQGRADRGPRSQTSGVDTRLAVQERRLHRPLPRPARAQHQADQGASSSRPSPAPTGAATPSRPMLTRIYGTAFFSKEDLDEHLRAARAGRARDHRKLGPRARAVHVLRALTGHAVLAADGMARLERAHRAVARGERWRAATARCSTPILYDVELWKQSGHWDKYRDNMYFTDVEGRPMGLKPMNCPAHVQLYKDERRSYRDLPVRYSEQGLVHRHEPSGTLHGLLRVRHITQDDAPHLLHRGADRGRGAPLPRLRLRHLHLFGFEPRLELSTRPEKRIGTDEMWDRAEAALAGGARAPGARVRARPGRRRLLRAEDRPAHDRLDRPLVAARHRPARLPDARALRARPTPAPTTPSTAR